MMSGPMRGGFKLQTGERETMKKSSENLESAKEQVNCLKQRK